MVRQLVMDLCWVVLDIVSSINSDKLPAPWLTLLFGSISDFEPDPGGHEARERRPQGEVGQVRGCLTSGKIDGSGRMWPGHKIAQKSAWQPWRVNNLLLLAPRRSTLAVMERHGGDDKSTVAGVWPVTTIIVGLLSVGWLLVTYTQTSPANVNIHQNNRVLPHEEESAYNLLDEYDKVHMYTHTYIHT